MGYELERLKNQYGVSSATSTSHGTPAENAAYAAAYRNRVANTPQYLQGQYETKTATSSSLPTFSEGSLRAHGAGVDPNKEVQNWFARNPRATPAEVASIQAELGVSDRDIRNAMGSGFRYGKSDDPSNYAPGYTGSRGSESVGYGSTGVNSVGRQEAHQQIRAWLAANPNATDAQIRAKQSEVGASNRDVYDATGNFWGNTLNTPTSIDTTPISPWGTVGKGPGTTATNGPTIAATTGISPWNITGKQSPTATAPTATAPTVSPWVQQGPVINERTGQVPHPQVDPYIDEYGNVLSFEQLGLDAGGFARGGRVGGMSPQRYAMGGEVTPDIRGWYTQHQNDPNYQQELQQLVDHYGITPEDLQQSGIPSMGAQFTPKSTNFGFAPASRSVDTTRVAAETPSSTVQPPSSTVQPSPRGVLNGQFTGPVGPNGMHVDRYGNERAAETGLVEGTGYYSQPNRGSQYRVTTNAQGERGMLINGQFVPSDKLNEFYEGGGNANEMLASYGVTNPWEVGGINAAARAAGNVQMSPMENMQAYFKEYQKYNPTGKHANDFEGFVTDQDPFTQMNMRTGQYTGAVTSLNDFEPGGIYGPGSSVYGKPGYGSGLGPRGIGTNGGDWQDQERVTDAQIMSAYNRYKDDPNFEDLRAAAEKRYGITSEHFNEVTGNRFAKGGRVKTHFQTGGTNDLTANGADIPSMGNREPTPQELSLIQADAKRNNIQSPFINLSGEPEPQTPAPGESREAHLLAMLSKYQPKESAYAAEYQAARGKSDRETQAFQDMLQKAIEGQQDQGPSQSEKYFRLAAAFGAPTKTGHFGETMGNAAGVLGDFNKEQRLAQRAGQSQALQLGLQGQQARMAAAKEDLNSLRSLTGEEMKDKRTITTELIKDYMASGKPQSTAGKQAIDEGLVQGTAPYQKRVAEIANMNVEKQLAQINSTVAGMTVAQANLELAQAKGALAEKQAAKLTPSEMKLKSTSEDLLANLDQAKADIKQAFALNPNTFDSSLPDIAQRKVLEAAGSKDQKLLNTRVMDNLLSTGAISQLREKFGSQFTQAEGKLWMELQGVGSKSKEERAKVMANMYKALVAKAAKEQKRLNEINQGLYRNTTPTEEGIE